MENLAAEHNTMVYLLRDRPGVLIIYAILVLIICVTILLLKYPKFLNGLWKRRAEDIEAGKQVHLADRHGLVEMVQKTMAEVSALKQQFKVDIDEIANFYMGTTKRFSENDNLIKMALRFSCLSTIYGDKKLNFGFKINAILTYLKMHGNGSALKYIVQLILDEPNGIQQWEKAQDDDMQINGPSEDKIYLESVCWINARLK